MRAYTDAKQSMALNGKLPYDTADATLERVVIAGCNLGIPEEQQYVKRDIPFYLYSGIGIPCWSLTALLNALPSSTLDSSDDHHYRLRCEERFTEWHENPIDACIEMVLKLNVK